VAAIDWLKSICPTIFRFGKGLKKKKMGDGWLLVVEEQ